LHATVEGAGPEIKRESFLLDYDRSSRIAVLSGARGTGKTTAFLTLQQACTQGTPKDVRTIGEWQNNRFRTVAANTVWLETIDLEMLPSSANLLSGVLARVYESVRTGVGHRAPPGERRGVQRSRHGLLERGPDGDPLLRLNNLQGTVARYWTGGNLDARSASLDPDVYAVEVVRASQGRLSFYQELNETLEDLARLFDRDRGVVFVLPVDDFDLNPSRCFELLRLLREISVPRLFTILIGDVRVAETIVNLQVTKELASVAGPALTRDVFAHAVGEIQEMGPELASHLFRKLIPPNQVIQLSQMSVDEALRFRPITGTSEDRDLRDLLAKCQLRVDLGAGTPEDKACPSPVTNLADFLLAPLPARGQGSDSTLIEASAFAADLDDNRQKMDLIPSDGYRGRALLQTSPRRAVDLWLALSSLIGEGTGPAGAAGDKAESAAADYYEVVRALGRHAKDLIFEDSRLLASSRRLMEGTIVPRPDGMPSVDPETFTIEPLIGPELAFVTPAGARRSQSAAGSADEKAEPEVRRLQQMVRVGPSWGWSVRPADRVKNLPDRPPALEEETAAALMVYQDLCAIGPDPDAEFRPLLPYTPTAAGPTARHSWWALTEWRADNTLPLAVYWPLPPWPTFWEYDMFLVEWNKAVKFLRGDSAQPKERFERLLFHWIDAATAMLRWESPLAKPDARDLDWDALVERIAGLHDKSQTCKLRAGVAREWLIRIGFLLMPEVIGRLPEVTRHFAPPKSKSDSKRTPAVDTLWEVWVAGAHEVRWLRGQVWNAFKESKLGQEGRRFFSSCPQEFPRSLVYKTERPPKSATAPGSTPAAAAVQPTESRRREEPRK
jgi:hypothetical protein